MQLQSTNHSPKNDPESVHEDSTPNPLVKNGHESPSPTISSETGMSRRPTTLGRLISTEFYQQPGWFDELFNFLFKLERRNTTIRAECYYGVIHFISCFYCLAVIPQQLSNAGYSTRKTIVASALCTGFGSIIAGLFANLPFVLAPPTVVSIFLSVYLQQYELGPQEGSLATVISGIALLFFGWRPLGQFVSRLIPIPIQVGTAVGIGLLTALAGSTEINLVVAGDYTILKMGNITAEICIAIGGMIFICVGMRYHLKGAFAIAIIFCSLIWWIYDNDFPEAIAVAPKVATIDTSGLKNQDIPLLTLDLVFLYVLYLNGLLTSLSNLAYLTRKDSTIPRGRWIYIICGGVTVLSGCLSSAPILVSPESASSIKEGAKTGLSAVVAGVLFLLASFFSPVFEKVPSAGSSGVLIMIGIILFQNVGRIDWRNLSVSAPAFVVLFYIPFTYSIIQGKIQPSFGLFYSYYFLCSPFFCMIGVILGYIVYLSIGLCTGELLFHTVNLFLLYFPRFEKNVYDDLKLRGFMEDRKTFAQNKSSLTSKKESIMLEEPSVATMSMQEFDHEGDGIKEGEYADFHTNMRASEAAPNYVPPLPTVATSSSATNSKAAHPNTE